MEGYTFIRTCDACGYKLKLAGEPKNKETRSYIYRKCPQCKSEAFDYGSWKHNDPNYDWTKD